MSTLFLSFDHSSGVFSDVQTSLHREVPITDPSPLPFSFCVRRMPPIVLRISRREAFIKMPLHLLEYEVLLVRSIPFHRILATLRRCVLLCTNILYFSVSPLTTTLTHTYNRNNRMPLYLFRHISLSWSASVAGEASRTTAEHAIYINIGNFRRETITHESHVRHPPTTNDGKRR